MKSVFFALALAILGPSCAQAETIQHERFGCHAQQVTERLFQLVQAGDESGFGRLLNSSLASGECKSWKSGEEVTLESRTIGYACIFPTAAGGQCYWTPISAIEK